MRILTAIAIVSTLSACSTQRSLVPREYLDEQTTATITVAAEPLIFVIKDAGFDASDRDFISLHAIDVNRMGTHRQFFAVLQSVPAAASTGEGAVKPVLELQLADRTQSLQPTNEDPQQIGIVQPIAPSYSLTAKWWYFPVDRDTLKAVAATPQLGVALVLPQSRMAYEMMRDGRAELAELTSVLR
jgi:hypothetical protein